MLSNQEREDLEYFQSWESYHKTNISNRINLEKNRTNADKYATIDQISTTLNNLRFVHQIVFDHNPTVFFNAVDYIFRAIGEKTIEMKIFGFLMNTAYVVSVQQVMNHIMTDGETLLLLEMTNFCRSYLTDMERMKNTLFSLIHKDLSAVTMLSYLKLILNFNQDSSQVFLNVIDLAMVLSTSCGLTKYSKGCQAVSIISWVARHIDIDSNTKIRLSALPSIPTLFFSPSRINQFSQYLKISQAQIAGCCRDMQEFYIKYYTSLCNRKVLDEQQKILQKRPRPPAATDMILEESENDSDSANYSARQLGYTFKPARRLSSLNRFGDSHSGRGKSKHRLRNIRKCRSATR